jgi:hypothetical protein
MDIIFTVVVLVLAIAIVIFFKESPAMARCAQVGGIAYLLMLLLTLIKYLLAR